MLKALFWGIRPQGEVKVRFAPSPTGLMHIGGLRTALFNFVFAKKFEGSFILRIEDTDRSRCTDEATTDIIDTLKWAGLKYDEGPYFQSKRLSIYQQYCHQLLAENKAYPCFCSAETIHASKLINQMGEAWRYDGTCSKLSPQIVEDRIMAGHRYTVRFRMQNEAVKFNDLVYGRINVNPAKVEGDFIILRSDGWPTYHLACVVDDHLMEISHVLRGVEWQQSTGKHIQLYNALGWPHPVFSHLPLLTNKDGKKLSKRDGDGQLIEQSLVSKLRSQGIYPEVVLSHLIHYTGDIDCSSNNKIADPKVKIITIDQMIDIFDPLKLNKSYKHLSHSDLLLLNRTFMSQANNKVIFDLQREIHRKYNINASYYLCKSILHTYMGRSNSISELVHECEYLWHVPQRRNIIVDKNQLKMLTKFIDTLNQQKDSSQVANKTKQWLCNLNANSNDVVLLKLIRVITTGQESGPPISDIIKILGFDEFYNRLTNFIN